MGLSEKEQAILEVIRKHPFYSQQDIADALGMSRSALANNISDLIRRNYLLGRAYIINDDAPVICIGGMNVDRKFYASQALIQGTSNPVSSSVSIGGVGRNIAENLGRLGETVIMLSKAGNDHDWELIKSLIGGLYQLATCRCQSRKFDQFLHSCHRCGRGDEHRPSEYGHM